VRFFVRQASAVALPNKAISSASKNSFHQRTAKHQLLYPKFLIGTDIIDSYPRSLSSPRTTLAGSFSISLHTTATLDLIAVPNSVHNLRLFSSVEIAFITEWYRLSTCYHGWQHSLTSIPINPIHALR
jgi:hypothetical protein